MNVIILVIVTIIVSCFTCGVIPSVYAWSFGDFMDGDTFVYDICDYTTLDPYTAVSSKCYTIHMTFLNNVETDSSHIWLIHVTFDGKKDIILVDESFKIKSIYHKYIATSLDNTLFWMSNHGKIKSFDYTIGDIAGTIPSRYSDVDVIVSDFVKSNNYTKYLLSWFISNENQLWIRDDIPLPVEAVVFSESHIGNDTPYAFTFSLVESNKPNTYAESSFDVRGYNVNNVTSTDVIANHTIPDVIANHTIPDVMDNHTLNITDTTYAKHFDISENISDEIIVKDPITSTSPKQNVLINDEPTVPESEIIPNDIHIQSVSKNKSEPSKQKPGNFMDEFFSFLSSLLNIK